MAAVLPSSHSGLLLDSVIFYLILLFAPGIHGRPTPMGNAPSSRSCIMVDTQTGDQSGRARAITNSIHDHWVLFLIEGVVLLLLGLAAIFLPVLAAIAFTIVIGWVFVISGAAGLFTIFWMRHGPGFWWSLLSAVISVGAGMVLLRWPISGSISLTLVLTAFFIVEGIASIMYAIEHRNQLTGRWGWMLASGIVDLILAAVLFLGLPGTAFWALGLLVGFSMLFGGVALIGMALAARHPGSL
jgi:uncharacterized membrane protein HdeD (DUF308 family)